MTNQKQLLNKDNWLKYLQLADEGGLTNNAKANDIVSMIEKVISDTRCCDKLKDRNDDLSELSKDLIKNVEKKVPYISLPEDEKLYTSLHRLKIELLKNL